MSPEQSRACRAWLGWSQDELARRAEVGVSTVKDFERGGRKPMVQNIKAMRAAIEAAGMTLLFDGDRSTGIALTDAGDSKP